MSDLLYHANPLVGGLSQAILILTGVFIIWLFIIAIREFVGWYASIRANRILEKQRIQQELRERRDSVKTILDEDYECGELYTDAEIKEIKNKAFLEGVNTGKKV